MKYGIEFYERLYDNPDHPDYYREGSPRMAQEVFQDIYKYLEAKDLLPNEYMSLDFKLNDCQLPEFIKMLINVDYGGSEGIYLDADLVVIDCEKQTRKQIHFITAKTLDASPESMDRMHLIASEIRKVCNWQGDLPEKDSSEGESK